MPPEESEELQDSQDPFQRFACPGCAEDVDVPTISAGKLVRCPYCNTDFFASAGQSHEAVVDDTDSEMTEEDRLAAFDKLRIQSRTKLRMASIRARSWWLIGFILALVVELDMLVNALIYIWSRSWGWAILRLILGVFAFIATRHALRRAAEFKLESQQSALEEPTAPPDFSTLNDGSDRWKELENIR